jgi:glycosyltransferase involved in cell wall biosynthesis
MKIGLLLPSIYSSPTKYPDMIFAPRDLAIDLVDGLVDRGHEVWFFTAPDVQTKAKLIPGNSELLFKEFIVAKLKSDDTQRLKWASFFSVKQNYEIDLTEKCYKMARDEHFDIIHSYHDFVAHFFDDLSGIPTVYTLHDPLPTEEKDVNYWFMQKFAHQKYISISNAYRNVGIVKPNFIETIYHGINLAEYPFSERPEDMLIAMGRMVPNKGINQAIDASRMTHTSLEIATSDMDVNMHLPFYTDVIAPKLTENLRVTLTGFLRGENKAKHLGNAKAFLFPIQWEEPFGMVMIEAMACGTPVIAYNRGSVSEIVVDGVTGFIIEDDESESSKLAGHTEGNWVIKKRGIEGLVEAIGRIGEIDRGACRRHVEEHFTTEKMVENHEKVYQRIIDERK